MHCSTCREIVSARLDGEATPLEGAAADAHLASCPACTRQRAAYEQLHRRVRLAPAEAVPDLSARILAAVSSPSPSVGPARAWRVGPAVVALALLFVLLAAAPASAHAQLVSTSPASGELVAEPPERAVVRFTEGVQADADALRLHDRNGDRVDVGELARRDGGKVLQVGLPALPDGGYVLTWRVVSLDGHPISGGVSWRVGEGSVAVEPTLLESLLNAEEGERPVAVAVAVARTLAFGGLLVLVGGLLFVLLVSTPTADDPRLRRLLRVGGVVAAVATALGIALHGADIGGGGLADAVTAGAVDDALATTSGRWLALRLLAVSALTALLWGTSAARVRARSWQLLTQVAVVAALAAVALGGHARTGRWAGLAVPVDVVHLLAAALWIGGLGILALVVLPRGGARTPAVAARFSSVAAVAVGVVVATGIFQSVRQLDGLDGLRDTGYGRLLVLKVVAVAVVVVLGAFSRSVVRALAGPGLESGDEDDVRRTLRRSVGVEAVVAVVVVALTALLVAADPGGAASGGEAYQETRVVDSTVLEVVAAPARPGPVDVHLYVTDPSIGLTTELEATAQLSLPGRDIAGLEVPLRYAGRGHWSAYDFDVPIGGDWRLDVTVVIGTFEQREATFSVPIG